ncbi:MAG: 2-oxo acid dehydrogenase subunit E2 [Lachnospiraceae bacterium]|nr:2-oxo acid dehydrogenase subunit E2 [Lachnospiraceae bacterium]
MAFVKATPYARKIARQYHIDLSAVTPSGSTGAVLARDVERARERHKRTREVPVTPLALRIAEAMHIDLDTVRGTGVGGKISKADVLAAAGRPGSVLLPGERRETLTPMMRSIAAQMTAASRVPTTTVTTKVDVTAMEEMRAEHNGRSGIRYSVNDVILMAAARSLTKHRNLLCSFAEDSIIYKSGINLGMAVAMEDENGLIVPVITEADQLSPDELATAAHDLARRTRGKKISPAECEGSTFTVTNLGMFGVEAFTPLLNLPNAATMGVCAIYNGVAVKDGRVEVRKLLHLCLTFDHRALNGAAAAKFNLTMREHLENPGSLFSV